jgi:hypothetical protein
LGVPGHASDGVVAEIPLPISVAFSSSEFDADGGGALHGFYTPSEPSPHMRGARSIPTTPTETAALRGVFGFSGEGFCWLGRARCFRGTVPTVGARDSVGKGDRTTRPSNQI